MNSADDDTEVKLPDFCDALAALVTNPDLFIAGDHFWVVLSDGHGEYQAAWIDENGYTKTATRRYRKAALTLASESWGR